MTRHCARGAPTEQFNRPIDEEREKLFRMYLSNWIVATIHLDSFIRKKTNKWSIWDGLRPRMSLQMQKNQMPVVLSELARVLL